MRVNNRRYRLGRIHHIQIIISTLLHSGMTQIQMLNSRVARTTYLPRRASLEQSTTSRLTNQTRETYWTTLASTCQIQTLALPTSHLSLSKLPLSRINLITFRKNSKRCQKSLKDSGDRLAT